MLLVVLAHAALAYVEIRIPRLLWAVRDPSRSFTFDAIFWTSVGVAMPIFFALGGLGAAQIFDRRGPRGYAEDRAGRILAPFLGAVVGVLPITLAVWATGWLTMNWCTWRQLLRLQFLHEVIRDQWHGPAHLWFLQYLLLMLAVYGVVRTRVERRHPSVSDPFTSRVNSWPLSPWAPFLAAIPTVAILAIGHARPNIRVDAVCDLRNSFLPDAFRWVHHAWFFWVGTMIARCRSGWNRIGTWWPLYLAGAGLALACRLSLLKHDLVFTTTGWSQLWLATSGACFGWFSFFGLWGLARRFLKQSSPVLRQLANASYWTYLTHFPWVGLAQIALRSFAWSAGVKFAAVSFIGLGMSAATYTVFVHNRRLGRWLEGGTATRVASADLKDSERALACPEEQVGLR